MKLESALAATVGLPPLQCAFALAKAGVPVFPFGPRGPHTSRGFYDASADPIVVLHMRWPGAMVAIRSGITFDAIDFDGTEPWPWLPTSLRYQTSDEASWHVLFRPTPGLGNRDAAPGVNVRATNATIRWWPQRGHAVIGDTLEPLPDRVRAMIELHRIATQRRSSNENVLLARGCSTLTANRLTISDQKRIRGIVAAVAAAPVGKRDDMLFWAAMRLTEFPVLQLNLVREMLCAAARTNGQFGEEPDRVCRTIDSGWKTGNSC